MNISMFYHSLISDWNHGNAHFLRGIVSELIERGHNVKVYEQKDNWSLSNLIDSGNEKAVAEFHIQFPDLYTYFYEPDHLNLDQILEGQDLVIVHEWNDHDLVKNIGRHKSQRGNYVLLFHDTHHRSVTDPDGIKDYDLSAYDGVLAYGEVIREIYLEKNYIKRAWTWHEAADTRIFYPREITDFSGDLVWIGNWGDEERTKELFEYLIEPVQELGLKAKIYGVRYPEHALKALYEAGIEYGGWLPNYKVPEVFSKFKVTVHVPRRPYVEALPGIPTIRPFEALACGIPLVSAPWNDIESLFTMGKDYLLANNKEEMKQHLISIINNGRLAHKLSIHGLETIKSRHSCIHRVDELLRIVEKVKMREEVVR
jgi:spore maturation protein CgeB